MRRFITSLFIAGALIAPVFAFAETPVASGQNIKVTFGQSVEITLEATGDDIVFEIVTEPEFGTLGSLSENKIVYTPDGTNEMDEFSFVAKSLLTTKITKEGSLSQSAQTILDELVASLKTNIEDETEIKFKKIKYEDGEFEEGGEEGYEINKGDLTEEEIGLVNSLIAQIREDIEVSEADEVEVEIEIEVKEELKISVPATVGISITMPLFLPIGWTDDASVKEVKVTKDTEIVITTASGSDDTVVLDEGTEITREDGEELDTNLLESSDVEAGSLTGLGSSSVIAGALQWGIPSATLQFSKPIIISIFVGEEFNGETLDAYRSVDGSDWTQEGIEDPKTCEVSDGMCIFKATKASYYAAFSIIEEQTSGGGSSGGGSGYVAPVLSQEDSTEKNIQLEEVEVVTEENEITANPKEDNGEEVSEFPTINTLEGVLKVSDNLDRGNLMIMFEDTVVYIKTSRNLSDLIGKNIIATVSGTLYDFTLLQIEEDGRLTKENELVQDRETALLSDIGSSFGGFSKVLITVLTAVAGFIFYLSTRKPALTKTTTKSSK